MKKLSLVLALILVLTCGILAACGDDTTDTSSTAATSSKAAAEESSEAAVSSEAEVESEAEAEAESEVASEAESEAASEPAEESTEAPAADITGENIAGDATYTVSQLYQQGGADVEWGWDPNAAIAYPDEDGVTLNDGVLATGVDFTEAAWVGFHSKAPDYGTTGYHTITFDLGAATDITGAKAYVGTADLTGGIAAPASIELLVSDDGETWTSVTTVTPTNVTTEAGTATELVELAGAANGQYVQLRLIGDGWCFVSEVEIFA